MKRLHVFLVLIITIIGMTSPGYAVDPVEEAEYLIITHPQLDNGGWLSDLTALQESRGYAVGVWYVNDQVTSNTDIQQLINDAYLSGIPVQYVLLAGMAANQTPETPLPENQKQETRDLKNPTANALELNFIPFTYENMEIWGGDVVDVPTDDHYYPSMHIQNNPIYIGRVPARTSQEMSIWVNKLQETYQSLQQYASWKDREILLSHNITIEANGCIGWKVDYMNDKIATTFPSSLQPLYLRSKDIDSTASWGPNASGEYPFVEPFETMMDTGSVLMHFVGTGATPSYLGMFYFNDPDVTGVTDYNFHNQGQYPYFLGNSCNLGNIQEPTERPSVTRKILFAENGGFIGALAPTIVTSQWGCREFSYDYHRLLFDSSFVTTGELTRHTKKIFEDRIPQRIWHSRGYVNYGDPSMPLALNQYKSGHITEDVTWQGSIVVTEPVTVTAGATLHIKPGTGVFFKQDAGLIVDGLLDAKGTTGAPIRFAAATDNPEPGYWEGIEYRSNSEIDLANLEIRDADIGLSILFNIRDGGWGSGGAITGQISELTSHFNNVGVQFEQVGNKLTLTQSDIGNNTQYGIWLVESSPAIRHCHVRANNTNGIYAYRKSAPRLAYNEILMNGTENAISAAGIMAVDGSDVQMYGITRAGAEACSTNNVIMENEVAGIQAYEDAYPMLGKYNEDDPAKYGGFNRITKNGITIVNANRREMAAQVNYWYTECEPTGPADLQGQGEVLWEPPAPLEGFGKPAGRTMAETNALWASALATEMSGRDSLAAAQYRALITAMPDSAWIDRAVHGLVRCWQKLGLSPEEISVDLQSLLSQYSGTVATEWLRDNYMEMLLQTGEYESALAQLDILESTSLGETRPAIYAYEQARITEYQQSDPTLGKMSQPVQALYERVLSEYPDSPVASMAAAKLGTTIPEPPSDIPLPDHFALHHPYPNPFNPATTVEYELPAASTVSIDIYNILGRQVYTVNRTHESPGIYSFRWDGIDNGSKQVSSGAYFIRLSGQAMAEPEQQENQWTAIRKVIYLR